MKSNVYRISRGHFDIKPILDEATKVAEYTRLSRKASLYLRLLAEELVSMLPAIVRDFDGEFWIENEGTEFELKVRIAVEDMDITTRDELIMVSSRKENASAVGITGKICAVFDYMAFGGDEGGMISAAGNYGFATDVDSSYLWSLRQYENGVSQNETEKWDELEKSVLAKLADDVIVGVRRKKVNITIKKRLEDK